LEQQQVFCTIILPKVINWKPCQWRILDAVCFLVDFSGSLLPIALVQGAGVKVILPFSLIPAFFKKLKQSHFMWLESFI
jgi:hypothetical protein